MQLSAIQQVTLPNLSFRDLPAKKLFNKVMSKVYFAGLLGVSLIQLHSAKAPHIVPDTLEMQNSEQQLREKPVGQLTLGKIT